MDEIVCMYDGDGTVLGELRYVISRAVGRAHCGLCDITHGTFRRKPTLDAALARLGVPVELLHRDEQPAGLAALTAGRLPAVAARCGDAYAILLGPHELQACAGDPIALVDAVQAAFGC